MMKKLIMFCVVLISVNGMANAAPTYTITFDEFPLGTMIDDEYAAMGVEFIPGDVTPRLPQISMNGAMPDQPILRPTGEPEYIIFQGDFWMHFTTTASEVTFDSGFWDSVGVGVINVYDPYMLPLANLTNTNTGVNVTNISGRIGYIYFNSIADGAGADIDNLHFTQIPTPGAILLCSFGAGVVGWLRRRKTL